MKTTSSSHTLDNLNEIAHELAKDKTPLEIGDILSEYQKKWQKQLNDIIEKHRDYAPEYFILQWIYKVPDKINALRSRTFIRRSRPDADWNTDCYSFDNRTNQLTVEWTLPPKESYQTILRNHSQYDPFLVECIRQFLAGQLNSVEIDFQDASVCQRTPLIEQKSQ